MEMSTQVILLTANSMEKDFIDGRMEALLKDNSKMVRDKAKESGNQALEINSKVNIQMI